MAGSEWYYFNSADTQWRVNFTSGVWDKLPSATGWNYYKWPYAYSVDDGSWYWFNISDEQWCVGMTSGQWSKFGIPAGMVSVPAGSFNMGDNLKDGASDERPVHAVTVSAFYMDKYEMTNDKIVEILNWAYGQGKLDMSVEGQMRNAEGTKQLLMTRDDGRLTWDGSTFGVPPSKGAGYPCVGVSWYGAVAICNYRSEKEGLTPCYNMTNWSCNWNANGYRLPTEAEWEKAARGGAEGKRFPWSDTPEIKHVRADYYSSAADSYDTSATRGRHPDYNSGGAPYTSPVDTFKNGMNGYGLYDMAGNAGEWCWDFYASGYYGTPSTTNPHGSATGSFHVYRGGSWEDSGFACRVADRQWSAADWTNKTTGFRCIRCIR